MTLNARLALPDTRARDRCHEMVFSPVTVAVYFVGPRSQRRRVDVSEARPGDAPGTEAGEGGRPGDRLSLPGDGGFDLAENAQQIIYDSIGWTEPARGVLATCAWLPKFERRGKRGPWRVASDLNWRRLKFWRRMLSQALDPNTAPTALDNVREVLVEHGPHAVIQAWELVSWLSSRLGWKVEVELMVHLPEYIPPVLLRQVLDDAGRLIGVGDFRPTFGRFAVSNWDVQDR